MPNRVSHYCVNSAKFDTIGAAITHIVYDLASKPSQIYVTFIDDELVPQTRLLADFVSPDKIIQYVI